MLNKMMDIVKNAAQIMIDAHNIEENTIKKGDRNFVTVYDTKIQNYVKNEIKKAFPDAKFIGEEEDCDKEDPYTGLCFILDPIDGTANFTRKYNHSAVSLAAVQDGVIIAGVVMNPFVNEIFYAERGKGAYLNGKRIHTSERNLQNSVVAFGTSPYAPELTEKTINILKDLVPCCEDLRRCGAASLDLCYVADGRCDMYFEFQVCPWDHAAGDIIVEEAGGIVTDRNGNKLNLHTKTEIFAGNKIAYKEFFEKQYLI